MLIISAWIVILDYYPWKMINWAIAAAACVSFVISKSIRIGIVIEIII